jgi:NTP pyrophosphatase (non-canonical NTP hydrolase)
MNDERDGHEPARDLISYHGTDRYPTVSSQAMKVTGEWGELNEAILKDHDRENVAKEYGDVGLALHELGNKLGLDLGHCMRDVVDRETRTFDRHYEDREAG